MSTDTAAPGNENADEMSIDVSADASTSAAGKPAALVAREVARRRTFGIISHPDAGKTTLTEKLLLFSGARAAATRPRTGWTSRSSAAFRSRPR